MQKCAGCSRCVHLDSCWRDFPLQKRITEKVIVPEGPELTFTRIGNVNDLIDAAQEVDELPFWAELWPSSLGLSSYLWQEVDLRNRRVLELGSGLGLSGIVAALKGARVTQTDFIRDALELARENARQNDVVTEQVWADWRKFPELGRYPIIIGSDILYEPEVHPFLEKIIWDHLEPGGQLILSDPGREWARTFMLRLKPGDWELTFTHVPVILDAKEYNIRVYRCKRR